MPKFVAFTEKMGNIYNDQQAQLTEKTQLSLAEERRKILKGEVSKASGINSATLSKMQADVQRQITSLNQQISLY